MKSRFQKLRLNRNKNEKDKAAFDPLVIELFDWDNEWADSLHTAPQGARGCECDLTWNLVDEAVGASQSLHGRCFPRAGRGSRARNSTIDVVQEELGSENEEEEEYQDPYDDTDVIDCEEDPNPNGGGGGGEATETSNILGEFDDGY